jgi:hypothetical protein
MLGPSAPFSEPDKLLLMQRMVTEVQQTFLRALAHLRGQGQLTADASVLPRRAGQVVLFQRIMGDWGFGDQDATTLLGIDTALDIQEIYQGLKPVRSRDSNDRLRAVLRIATDLDALFQDTTAIRDWLSEPQRDLDGASPRSLLTEGSMENLLRVKSYVSHLSGR